MQTPWDDLIDGFWTDFDESRPAAMLSQMSSLAEQHPGNDGAALYESAAVHDSTGGTSQAIDLYRLALEAGLDGARRPRALLQLASSLRAEGRLEECLAVLDDSSSSGEEAAAVIGEAGSVVRALALHDLGRHDDALRVALLALARELPLYQRSMTAYANALVTHQERAETSR
ncbi:tetratricopeptide repeat protein [Demequina aurantiaca]|uniref:tetratricopeptide repeat protein n=1 Tax=Demequina aurantiaca TaxID=676200 RepID=UPI003D335E64